MLKKDFNWSMTVGDMRRRWLGRQPDVIENNAEVGMEIEVEGFRLPGGMQYWWEAHHDGSLRQQVDADGQPMPGGEPREYVLKKPILRQSVERALTYLNRQLEKADANVIWSNRCSVHVHINYSNVTMRKAFSALMVYYIFEDLLSRYCGRPGNLFCLRAVDAEDIVRQFVYAIENNRLLHYLGDDMNRYAACNFTALTKFGSLEFRTMEGTTDIPRLMLWVNTLLRIKDVGTEYDNPRRVIEQLSLMGPREFAHHVLPQEMFEFILGYPDWEQSIYEGMRTVQPIAYSTEWVGEPVATNRAVEEVEFNPMINLAQPLVIQGNNNVGVEVRDVHDRRRRPAAQVGRPIVEDLAQEARQALQELGRMHNRQNNNEDFF